MLSHGEMILRITAGAVLGASIGYERGLRGRQLGLRTHILVALASSTFMVVSSQFAFYQGYEGDGGLVEVDSSRIAASVVSAVGFLAGGSILRAGPTVQGLTTAAGLWLVTAIGLCTGAGMYVEALFATTLGLFALALLRRFEDKDDDAVHRSLYVVTRDRAGLHGLLDALRSDGVIISKLQYDRVDVANEGPQVALTCSLKHSSELSIEGLLHKLEQDPAVRTVRIDASA